MLQFTADYVGNGAQRHGDSIQRAWLGSAQLLARSRYRNNEFAVFLSYKVFAGAC
jgi:hypothetical protein